LHRLTKELQKCKKIVKICLISEHLLTFMVQLQIWVKIGKRNKWLIWLKNLELNCKLEMKIKLLTI